MHKLSAQSRLSLAATATLGIAAAGSPALAERQLTAVSALQQNNILARSYRENYEKAVNQNCKGTVSIRYLGGQEVVPPDKAMNALKRGQFDILSSPATYFVGTAPEAYAALAANQSPRELRKNGAWKMMQEIYLEKAGVHLLAWGENQSTYYLYMTKEPKLKDGLLDLSGVKMRTTGTYRPLIKALGGVPISIKSSELLTALQRGTVDGFGFPDVSIASLGFYKVAKYRVMPNYYRGVNMLFINKAMWDGLSPKERDCMQQQAIAYETSAVKWVEAQRLEEEKILKAGGVIDVVMKGKAAEKYLEIAHEEIWKELKSRSQNHDKLKPLMYIPGKPTLQVQ